MNRSRLSLALAVFSLLWPTGSQPEAAEAVFSQDGGKIYLLDRQQGPGQLYGIDVKSGEMLPAGVPDMAGQPIVAVDRSNAGFILCLTESVCQAWDVGRGATSQVCGVPEGGVFVDLAYDPSTGNLAFVVRFAENEGAMRWELWLLPKGADAPTQTAVRRVRAIEGMAFDRNGELFFGADGDLWQGRIEGVGSGPDDRPGGALNAYRFAPLATRETADSTPAQIGVSTVVVAGPELFVHVQRMGGSGWGSVVRLAKPAVRGAEGYPFELGERIAAYQKALASVKILGENGTLAHLAASPDGMTVYFQAAREDGEMTHWLVRAGGEPQPFSVTAP